MEFWKEVKLEGVYPFAYDKIRENHVTYSRSIKHACRRFIDL